jgi:hypothetical protein
VTAVGAVDADSDVCACDHVLDEHDLNAVCTVEDCPCFYFEAADPDE